MINKDELVIGVVRGPVGLSGDVAVSSCSGETAHFLGLKEIDIVLGGKRWKIGIDCMEEGPRGLLVHFSGYNDPERLLSLAGAELVVPRANAAPLRENQYYAIDLLGCELRLEGKKIGTVLSLIEGGAYDFLETALDDGQTVCVPFLKEFLGAVDLEARSIELLKAWIVE